MSFHLKYLAVVICLASSSLFAQTTGTLQGTVTDTSGAVVPGAKVTAKLEGAAVTRSTTTDARGEFVMPTLPVGSYAVDVEATGFKKFVQAHVEVTLGHVINVNAVLELGEVTQTVEVQAAAAQVEKSAAAADACDGPGEQAERANASTPTSALVQPGRAG